MQQVKARLEWTNVWQRQSQNCPALFGVDQAYEMQDKTILAKYYRAWAHIGSSDTTIDEHLESDVYVACDAADVPQHLGYRHQDIGAQTHHAVQAAVARTLMKDNERSPNDMREIAETLHKQANKRWTEHQAELQAKRERAKALQDVTNWVDGLRNVLTNGTEEEKATLTTVFSQFMQKTQKKGQSNGS